MKRFEQRWARWVARQQRQQARQVSQGLPGLVHRPDCVLFDDFVESIIKLQAVTAVPFAPPFVEGMINLRGVVLPVIDLRKRLGLSAAKAGKETRIVIVELEHLTVGLMVDAVAEVLRLSDTAIEPPPPLAVTLDTAFITGIAQVGEQLIILLDLDKVLLSQPTDRLFLQPA